MTDADSAAGTSAAETTAPAPAEDAKIESPRLTYAILAVLAVAFVAEIVLSGWQNISLPFFSITPAALIALGGDYPPAFRDGEWHRLLIAPLLHVDLLHLAFNSLALYFAGSILERLLGRAWLGALYVLGGLSGSILSVAMGADNVVSVGASGAIMALITALAILAFRFPSGAERNGLLLNCGQVLIPALLPHNGPTGMTVDVSAHVGGAAAGVLIGAGLLLLWRRDRERPSFGPIAAGIGALGLLATAGSVVVAAGLYPVYQARIGGPATPQELAARRLAITQAAEKGDPTAMYTLGAFFQIEDKDFAQALAWYEKAAAKGNAPAMNEIGSLYANGTGVQQDYLKAREWFDKAAALGNTLAFYNLGYLLANGFGTPQDFAAALPWLDKAAAKDEPNALRLLGVFHEYGYGVAQDYGKARTWYEKAGNKGDANAMNSLGLLFENGFGVAKDFARARGWYEKAVEKGNATAMINLGGLYANGQGVAVDFARARALYEKAAEAGDATAFRNLAGLYASGLGVAQDDVKAVDWYGRAAQAGDTFSMLSLAVFTDQGKGGVARDPARAAQLLLQAAKGGSDAAKELLAGDMQGWEPTTLEALKAELVRLVHFRGTVNRSWDDRARQAVTAYLAAQG